ncbi:hypothetical protein ABW21_db0200924 [Orbilia brochopaga]|nr:hypothetical protein ABW21_db0200924 [Drechslerella brochopaga]
MKAFTSIITLALALTVAAAPAINAPITVDKRVVADKRDTIANGANVCGTEATAMCCNKQEGPAVADGNLLGLGGVLNGLSIFGECSSLDIFGGIGVGAIHDILASKCKTNAVCCSNNNQVQNGIANVGFNCLPISQVLSKKAKA